MLRGIYAAGSGMLVETLRADTIANKLANANTAGFLKDIAVFKDFASLMLQRIHDGAENQDIGTIVPFLISLRTVLAAHPNSLAILYAVCPSFNRSSIITR